MSLLILNPNCSFCSFTYMKTYTLLTRFYLDIFIHNIVRQNENTKKGIIFFLNMQFTIYKKEKILLEIKKRSERKCKTKSRFLKIKC